MVQFGNVAKVTNALDACNIEYVVYDGISGEPTDKMVAEGVKLYQENECDFLIGLGGGSPMDSAKAIGVMVASDAKKISDFMHKSITVNVPYLVAIPTTAGTGSEATQFTIIADTENNVKMLLAGPSVLPALAVVDPAFTMTAPPSVTAATGVDALCHAVEAYTSRKHNHFLIHLHYLLSKKFIKIYLFVLLMVKMNKLECRWHLVQLKLA